ncbi:uncharacterized protein LOC122244484 isoform X2 [Penaeus japonicus]|uniref:uncharacterized protein LOC122244484 isoform X2 n=1 Tax=Penaeus japonicus TaxID=27405 RepID=UPI001C71168C|nr:uncharacterized protein LOC122244484 isoform X2 [Penaeus japonicus]
MSYKRRSEQTLTMAANSITVQWNAHYSALLQLLKSARREDWYCDATILCNGKYYSVHKFVLAACSDYFEEMFNRIKGRHPMVVMTDMKTARLEALLSYMYEGEVDIMQEDLAGFMETAEAWKVKGLSSANDDQEQTEAGRRVQTTPGERHVPLPVLDQVQEYSKRRMALNNDWQKAKRMRYSDMIRDLPPISVTEETFSQNVCVELGHNPNIPSIVPGSAVSLSTSMKACNVTAEVKKNAEPVRGVSGSQAQQGESSKVVQHKGGSQNGGDDVCSDVSDEDIMVVDLKLEPGEVVENFSTYQAGSFTPSSARYPPDTPSSNDCIQDNSNDYNQGSIHNAKGRRKSKTGGDKSSNHIQVIPQSSVPRESTQLRDFQPMQGAARLQKGGQKKGSKDNLSFVVSSQPGSPKSAASKGKRRAEGPKQNLCPVTGKRKYTKKKTKVKEAGVSVAISESTQDPAKVAMPKRKVGRPRKIVQPPVANTESAPSSVAPKSVNKIQHTHVAGAEESRRSSPNSNQARNQDVSPECCKEDEKVKNSSLPKEAHLENAAPYRNLQCRDEQSVTPPLLEPPPESNANKSQSSARRLAASKRRTTLLRQFRKEASIVSETHQLVSETDDKKSLSATQVGGRVPWINRKKRIPNSRRWSKPKKNKRYRKMLNRRNAKDSGKLTVESDDLSRESDQTAISPDKTSIGSDDTLTESDKTAPPQNKAALGSSCSETENASVEESALQSASPAMKIPETGNQEETKSSPEKDKATKEGSNEHQTSLGSDEDEGEAVTEDLAFVQSPILFPSVSPQPEKEKLHCKRLSTSIHNDALAKTQEISEI